LIWETTQRLAEDAGAELTGEDLAEVAGVAREDTIEREGAGAEDDT